MIALALAVTSVPAFATQPSNPGNNQQVSQSNSQGQGQGQWQGQGQGQHQNAISGSKSSSRSSSNAVGSGVGVGVGGDGGSTGDYSTKNEAGPVVMYSDGGMQLPQAVNGPTATVLTDVYKFGPFGFGTQHQRMTPDGAFSWAEFAHNANTNDGTYEGQQEQAAYIATLCADENGFGEKLAEQLNIACK